MVGGEQDIDDISFENIKNINFAKFKTQLKPVMAKSDKFNLEEAKTKVISFLKALITIDEGEKKFIEKFRNKNYMPELLFDDEATIDNIKFHPMALWRCPCTMESSCKTSNAEMK